MKLTYPDAQQFRDIFATVNQFLDEANITVDVSGLSIKRPTHDLICFVDLKINAQSFEKLETDSETFGVNISSLLNVLKKATKEDKLLLEKTEHRVILTLRSDLDRTFKIPLIDVPKEDMEEEVKSLEFKAKATIYSDVLDRALKDAKTISDCISIAINNGVEFTTEDGVNDYKLALIQGDEKLIEFSGVGKSRYKIEYLEKLISKSKKLFDSITIKLSDDYPAKFEQHYGDKFALSLVVAPKVEID